MLENMDVERIFDQMWDRISEKDVNVVQYPYRRALLNNIIMELPRYYELEKELAKKAKKEIDNHTVYEITLQDGSKFAIMCHDDVMYLGLGVRREIW